MSEAAPTILLTRPRVDAEAFAARLRARGVESAIEIAPLQEIVATGRVPELDGVSGVLFTSRNAVASVDGRDLPAWCVGPATAEAAATKGWRTIVADGDVEALFARVLADGPNGPLVHLRGEISRGDLAGRLTLAGIATREVVVYRQDPRALSSTAVELLKDDCPVIVPLFSPRAAALFATHGPFGRGVCVVAMSEAVRDALGEFPRERIVLAGKKDAEAMSKAITRLLDAG